MANFTDKGSFKAWLETWPNPTRSGLAIALASRAAASVLPFLALSDRRAQPFGHICLVNFRLNLLAVTAAKFPARADIDWKAILLSRDVEPRLKVLGAAAAAAANAAAFAQTTIVTGSADFAADTAAFAANAIYSADAAPYGVAYARLSQDASLLERKHSGALRLMEEALWVGESDPHAELEGVTRELWRRLSKRLRLRKSENWKVWIDWYNALLDGETWLPELHKSQREDLTLAICQLPNEDWRDPKIVNWKIADMITAALEEARKGDDEPPRAVVPAQRPAAIEPIWRGGQLTLSENPVAADLSPEVFLAALRALHDECVDLIAAVRDEVAAQQARFGAANLDQRPAEYLERLVNMLGANIPAQHDLFRIGHVAQALSATIALVNESWPDFHALRFRLLVSQFGEIARRVPAWREFWVESLEPRPSQEEVAAAPQLGRDLADLLDQERGDEERPLIAPVLPQAVRDLAEEAERLQQLAKDAHEINEIQRQALEALAVDVFESADNILKSMAEAVVAGLAAVNRTGTLEGLKRAYSKEYPKQIDKLGKQLARVAVWAPVSMAVGGCAYLADKYAWLQPVLQLLKKNLGG